MLVNVHIVEYINDEAYCSHQNKQILLSLQDFRSVTENQNPGYTIQYEKRKTVREDNNKSMMDSTISEKKKGLETMKKAYK